MADSEAAHNKPTMTLPILIESPWPTLKLQGGMHVLEYLTPHDVYAIRCTSRDSGLNDEEFAFAVSQLMFMNACSISQYIATSTSSVCVNVSHRLRRMVAFGECSAPLISALSNQFSRALYAHNFVIIRKGHAMELVALQQRLVDVAIPPALCREDLQIGIFPTDFSEELFASSVTDHLLRHHRILQLTSLPSAHRDASHSILSNLKSQAIVKCLVRLLKEESSAVYLRFTSYLEDALFVSWRHCHIVLMDTELLLPENRETLTSLMDMPEDHEIVLQLTDPSPSIRQEVVRGLRGLKISHLTIMSRHVTIIEDAFLRKCSRLTSLDLSGLTNLRAVGNQFLEACSSLVSLNLDSLIRATCIGDSFLANCFSLETVHLEALVNVTVIQRSFLEGCCSLRSLDLQAFGNVHKIGTFFLQGCSALTTLDLAPLHQVVAIERGFLAGCSGLRSVDLQPLEHVDDGIVETLLTGCSSLTCVNLAPLTRFTSIGSLFLSGCRGLTDLNLRHLCNITHIGDLFLSACSRLSHLHNVPLLSNVTRIESSFLSGCTSLVSLDLSSMTRLSSIGNFFLEGCESLTAVDMRSLSSLKSLGYNCFYGCCSLASLDLSDMRGLETVGPAFVTECNRLVYVMVHMDTPALMRITVPSTVQLIVVDTDHADGDVDG